MGPAVLAPTSLPTSISLPASSDVENSGPHNVTHHRKIKHRSSKPILAWVQRKFTGAGSTSNPTKHVKEHSAPASNGAHDSSNTGGARPTKASTAANGTGGAAARSGSQHRRHSEPRKTDTHPPKGSSRRKSAERVPSSPGATTASAKNASMRRKAVRNQHSPSPIIVASPTSVESRGTGASSSAQTHGSDSSPPSPHSTSLSFAAGSTWSNPPEADDDASIRPLPPTSPPSPAPSRSTHHTISSYTSGGYLSDPKTFRSGTASTKPTTLLSIDVNTTAAHIAQAPPSATGGASSIAGTAPSSPSLGRFPSGRGHAQGPSTTSITFSNLPSGTRHPLASTQVAEAGGADDPEDYENDNDDDGENIITQAPNLSQHHPRNNPHPMSPPLDNASVLTLASSAAGQQRLHGGGGGTPSIASRFPGSVSHGGGGNYNHRSGSSVTGLGIEGYEGDPDASVRALRPRSRRGSWGSVTSTETGWSAAVHALGPGARKTGAGGSLRTGEEGDEDGGEEQSIQHAQIDEEDVSSATSAAATFATANGGKDRAPLPRKQRESDPSVFSPPTLDDSKATTLTKENDEPVMTMAVPVKATESEGIKAKANAERLAKVAAVETAASVPVAKGALGSETVDAKPVE